MCVYQGSGNLGAILDSCIPQRPCENGVLKSWRSFLYLKVFKLGCAVIRELYFRRLEQGDMEARCRSCVPRVGGLWEGRGSHECGGHSASDLKGER